jgi:hypothetical protein
LKHISGSGRCLRWLCSWILILLDEILQYNRIWQFSYGRRPSLMTRVANGPTHPPAHNAGWMVCGQETVFGCIPIPSQSGWSSTQHWYLHLPERSPTGERSDSHITS